MIHVISEIEIPASPRRVWDVLIDFANYPRWNPDVAIRGVAATGNEVEWSSGSTPVERRKWTTALIIECDEPRTIAWSLGVRGLFTLEERFSLERISHGTMLRHEVVCRGVISKLIGERIRRRVDLRLSAINIGLHRYSSVFRGASEPTAGTAKTQGARRRGARQPRRRPR